MKKVIFAVSLFLYFISPVLAQSLCDRQIYDEVGIVSGPRELELLTKLKVIAKKGIDARVLIVKNPLKKSTGDLVKHYLNGCEINSPNQAILVYDATHGVWGFVVGDEIINQSREGTNFPQSLRKKLDSHKTDEVYQAAGDGLEYIQTEVPNIKVIEQKPITTNPPPPPVSTDNSAPFMWTGGLLLTIFLVVVFWGTSTRIKKAIISYNERRGLQIELSTAIAEYRTLRKRIEEEFSPEFKGLFSEDVAFTTLTKNTVNQEPNLGEKYKGLIEAKFFMPDKDQLRTAVAAVREKTRIYTEQLTANSL